jgi:hypothetical protein
VVFDASEIFSEFHARVVGYLGNALDILTWAFIFQAKYEVSWFETSWLSQDGLIASL